MKYLFSLVFVFLIFLIFTENALAICPLCALALSSGVGLSRWLGIDDVISGFWIGGLIVSLIFWTVEWLKRRISFYGKLLIAFLYYLIFFVALYFTGVLKENIIFSFWLSKMLLGIVIGSAWFWAGVEWHLYLKEKNGGKVYFPFQKVILPVGALLVLSLLFYFLVL